MSSHTTDLGLCENLLLILLLLLPTCVQQNYVQVENLTENDQKCSLLR